MERRSHRTGPPSRWPALIAAAVLGFSVAAVFGNAHPPSPSHPSFTPPPLAADGATATTTTTTTEAPAPNVPQIDGFPTKPAGWVELDPGPLVSRMGHAVAWTGETMLVWGGRSMLREYHGGGAYRTGPTEGPAWSFIAAAPIDGGLVSASVWTGDALFIHTSEPAWYMPATNSWHPIETTVMDGADIVAATWHGNQLVVLSAGTSGDTPGPFYGLDPPPAATCCRRLSPPPFDVDYGTLVSLADTIVFIGGHSSRTHEAPSFAEYRPSTDSWAQPTPPPLAATPGLDATWSGETLVAIDTELRAAAWTPDAGWQSLPDLPFDPLGCYPRAITFGGSVFVWHCRDAAWLDPATGTWIEVATPELPSHTVSTSCRPLDTDSSILLWCGNGDGSPPLLFEGIPGVVETASTRVDS